jgi:tetrapyrrole methylase family protein/MazG family protein
MPQTGDIESRCALGEKLKSNPDFSSMLDLIDTLLGERGCPWDQSRKLEDCPKYLKGELEEVIQAIEASDYENLEEELGDLFFMTAFTAKVGGKEGNIRIEKIFERIINKMVYRHPHVFGGDLTAETSQEVFDNWQILKEREKADGKNTPAAD